jgi:tetratricopeptide (TPR) repeat protein
LYHEVIAKSPDNAPAWAGLSLARLYQGGYGHAPLVECIREAKAAADRALELDDQLAEAHEAKGIILASYDFRFREGVEEVRKAVSLAPGASGPMLSLSMYEGALGSMTEAIRLGRRAQEIDPLNADTHASRGRAEVWARNWEDASEAYQRSLELSPNAARTYSSLGITYLRRGMGEKAIETIMKEVSPGYRYFALAIAYHELGRKKESDDAMARLLEESEDWGIQFASAHAARGETDQAFHWLERSYELHDTGIVMLKANQHFRNLHGDPRWPRFLEKVGLEPLS